MTTDEREQLIESVGVNATSIISELQHKINELERFLDVVQVFRTTGFRYEKVIRTTAESLELKAIE